MNEENNKVMNIKTLDKRITRNSNAAIIAMALAVLGLGLTLAGL